MDVNSLITGEKFIYFADYRYNPNNCDDYNQFVNDFTKENIGDINNITVYTHIHWVGDLFNYIIGSGIKNKIILITHNSDHEVNELLYQMKPSNVIMWFSQNINHIANDLYSLPIGLENDRWFPEENKKTKLLNKLCETKTDNKLLYVNHSIRTYPLERAEPYELFTTNDWCDISYGMNGQGYDNYIDNVYNHKFVLCPRGNGIDTHRLWECLYLRSIPIVKKHINNTYYNELPILFVDNWSDINENMLNIEYSIIMNNLYNLDLLRIKYWFKKINLIKNNINE